MDKYTPNPRKSQEEKIIRKLAIKKHYNEKIVIWLQDQHHHDRAERVRDCATYVGITEIQGITKIVKANFCRERICQVCAWRRQSKFVAQMLPVLQHLKQDYEFIFATLTIDDVRYNELSTAIDEMLQGYYKLYHRKKISRAWKGIVRSVEITYKEDTDTFHPHIHLLIAVDNDYFRANNPDYITQQELCALWKEALNVDYTPICDIRKVNDTGAGGIETLKYSLKPSKNEKALSAFYYCLHGRRLVSFTGVFAKMRKALKLSSLDDLEDDIPSNITDTSTTFKLYRFDVTGGIYTYYQTMEMELTKNEI